MVPILADYFFSAAVLTIPDAVDLSILTNLLYKLICKRPKGLVVSDLFRNIIHDV